MRKLALFAALLFAVGCGTTYKQDMGLCMRPACNAEIHLKDPFCGGCGNCIKHCISAPFKGMNP